MPEPDAPFFVIGVATRTTNAAESDPTTARLPGLWEHAYGHPYLTERREQDGGGFVAVLFDYESDDSGAYTEVVGVRASTPGQLPEGLVAVRVPAGSRHHEQARGSMPDALIGAWQRIWAQTGSGGLNRSYRTDYEVHTDEGADLYVSVAASMAEPVSARA